MRATNLAVRFLLELAALASLAWWGWRAGDSALARVLLAVGAPAIFAAVWGLLIAPKATRRLPDPARLAVEVVLFAGVAAALVAAGAVWAGLVLAGAMAVSLTLMVGWGQRGL